jgi:hypothetical protein
LIEKAIILLGSQLVQVPPKRDNLVSTASVEKVVETEPAEPKKIDRQVKIALIILLLAHIFTKQKYVLSACIE